MSFVNPSDATIKTYLKEAKNIAIVGLSNKPDRTSYQIAELLQQKGYTIFPVNPMIAGQTVLNEKVYASLMEVPEKIDIVDIFRRSDALPEIAEDFVKTDAEVFWAQLGIESDEAATYLQNHNRNDIVMNRCIKIELNK
ncbi:CoA-binding protein [Vagococcus vulneris]|uniref:CoA-binding protein n=1 Tax=Vagococcus vulneris TaxID=1977869 RepID=A0A430A287_9ENTE|nr:CoA-binding protein [Vagococcus vulneris]RSU00583.1 CoA-binding protein [Vagococcus vulneris]